MKQFIAAVHHLPGFKDWLEEIEKDQPTIPLFNPQDHVHSTTTWAYHSGMIEGYKLLATKLGVNLDD